MSFQLAAKWLLLTLGEHERVAGCTTTEWRHACCGFVHALRSRGDASHMNAEAA